jgi:hypothetical protein
MPIRSSVLLHTYKHKRTLKMLQSFQPIIETLIDKLLRIVKL